MFGADEANFNAASCDYGYLHLPSIVEPMILDEEMKPMEYGNEGRFAFLDPLANSYPGFIATEDKMRILEHCPKCSRPGPVIESISRMPGAEDRGCAVAITKILQETGIKDL